MKKIALILILMVSISSVIAQAKMEFTDGVTWDFGVIKEVDGDVSHTFKFKNCGNSPLVIKQISVDCGCTTPHYSKAPTMPAAEGEIRVTFDPMGRPGQFIKLITIASNSGTGDIKLKITGSVIPRPRTLADDYPFYMTAGLRLADLSSNIGTVPRGVVTVSHLGVANSGNKAVKVEIDSSKLPAWVTARVKNPVLQPQQRSEILFTIDGTKIDHWGAIDFQYSLIINGVKYSMDLTKNLIFVENFQNLTRTQLINAPRAEYDHYFYHFSDQAAGTKLSHDFQITNIGKRDLEIRYFDTSSPNITAHASAKTIAPGAKAVITVVVDTKNVSESRLMEFVRVLTNDPEFPSREIRIAATIK